MSSEAALRQKIETRIAQHRNAIVELTELLKEEAAAAHRPVAVQLKVAPAAAIDETATGRGRPRKRRKAGWLGAQVDKILAAAPGQTIREVAEGIASQSGQRISPSLVNTYLSKGAAEGKYAKDASAGPRKTKWSLAGGSGASASEASENTKKTKKKG